MITFNEIEEMFTQEVAYYISNGFAIFTPSLRSLEGYLARVDLYKDNMVVRICLETGSDIDNRVQFIALNLYTGAVPSDYETIWANRLSRISCIKRFYHFSSTYKYSSPKTYFTDNLEEFRIADKIHRGRIDYRIGKDECEIRYLKPTNKILKRVRSYRGFKTAKLEDIHIRVYTGNKAWDHRYYVFCKDKQVYRL